MKRETLIRGRMALSGESHHDPTMRLSNTNISQSPPIHLAIYHNIYLCSRMNLRSKHHFLDQSPFQLSKGFFSALKPAFSSAIDQRLSLVDVLLQNRAVVAKLLDGGFERKESLAWSHAGPACGPQLFLDVVLCYKVLLSANCSRRTLFVRHLGGEVCACWFYLWSAAHCFETKVCYKIYFLPKSVSEHTCADACVRDLVFRKLWLCCKGEEFLSLTG